MIDYSTLNHTIFCISYQVLSQLLFVVLSRDASKEKKMKAGLIPFWGTISCQKREHSSPASRRNGTALLVVGIRSHQARAVTRKIFRGGGVDMNIRYRYSKIFKVNFYKVVYTILTFFGINITLLVNFFLCHCYRCLAGHKGFGKVAQNRGCGDGTPSRQQIFTVFT